MNKAERKKIIAPMKKSHAAYLALATVVSSPHSQALQDRFANFARKFRGFTRKDDGSQNALKAVANLVRLLFGLQEDLQRFRLPEFGFGLEKKTINGNIISALDKRLTACYASYGAPRAPISYGEALLNCYLDLFVTFTVLKTSKVIGAKPSYLVNPRTGNREELELDVEFEDFRLAFEFQGHPSHYGDVGTMTKDAFKLATLPTQSRILIPVNVSQLNSAALQSLIANSLKDHVGVHEVIANSDPSRFNPGASSPQQLLHFSKAIQRLYLARTLFQETLAWIDAKAVAYIARQASGGNISATTPAPRRGVPSPDLDLSTIYARLRYVSEIRKS